MARVVLLQPVLQVAGTADVEGPVRAAEHVGGDHGGILQDDVVNRSDASTGLDTRLRRYSTTKIAPLRRYSTTKIARLRRYSTT